MRKLCLTMAAIMLAACTPPQGGDSTDAQSVDAEQASKTAADLAFLLKNQAFYRKEEAPLLAAQGALAVRDGDLLTVSAAGHPIVTFQDHVDGCVETKVCLVWAFKGPVELAAPGTPGRTAYAAIERTHGYVISNIAFVEPGHGLTWFGPSPMTSPDGRFVADGSLGTASDDDFLWISDWTTPYPHRRYVFTAGCEVLNWLSPVQFRAICSHLDSEAYTVATVTRMKDGNWRLVETAEIEPSDDNNTDPVPGSILSLLTLSSTTAADQEAAMDSVAERQKPAVLAGRTGEGINWRP